MKNHAPLFAAAIALAVLASMPAAPAVAHDAKGTHSHDHAMPSRTFASIADGLAAVDATLKQAEAAVAESKVGAFHDLGMELHAVADGLALHEKHVPQAKQSRFEGAVNQLRSVGDRMHDVQASAPVADAQRLVTQARNIEQIVKANAQ